MSRYSFSATDSTELIFFDVIVPKILLDSRNSPTNVRRQWGMLTSLLLYPALIRAPTTEVSGVQEHINLCRPTRTRGIARVYQTPPASSDIVASGLKGILRGEPELQCQIGYIEAAAASAGKKSLLSAQRWVGYPLGCGHQKKQPGQTHARWNRDVWWQDRSYKEVLFGTKGDFILRYRQYSSRSAVLQGLIAGAVRFTHIFAWNNHPD